VQRARVNDKGVRQWESIVNLIRTQPWFDQLNFKGFNQAIPMKTVVIYCFDPRAADVPQAVAEHFGDEVYPGEMILDEAGNRVGSTRTLFTVTNGGGRASSALCP
jgi:carbonic anhydrase